MNTAYEEIKRVGKINVQETDQLPLLCISPLFDKKKDVRMLGFFFSQLITRRSGNDASRVQV